MNKYNKLFNQLPIDEVSQDEGIYTIGESLLNQFYFGNWSASVKEMVDNNYSVDNLLEYLDYLKDEIGCEYNSSFDNRFFAELGNSTVKLN